MNSFLMAFSLEFVHTIEDTNIEKVTHETIRFFGTLKVFFFQEFLQISPKSAWYF